MRTQIIWVTIFSLIASTKAIGEECEWLTARAGNLVSCQTGYVITAICASGRRSQCKDQRLSTNHHTMIKCCKHKYNEDPEHDCQISYHNYGINGNCPKTDESLDQKSDILPLQGLCTSSGSADCGPRREADFTELSCCETEDLLVGPVELCGWFYEDFGEAVTCPKNYVAAGACSSGHDRDCNGGGDSHGVFCCPSLDRR